MTLLRSILFAALTTVLTLLVMPLLALTTGSGDKPLMTTQLHTITWSPQQPPPAEPTLKQVPQPPQPPAPSPQETILPDCATPSSPRPPSTPLQRLTLTAPIPDTLLQLADTDLDFKLVSAPPSPGPVSACSATASGADASSGSARGSSLSSASSVPANSPLAERVLVKPRFPRNTAPVNGSLDLAFTVNPDGTVSDVTVLHTDSQLSFKYRREAIRAALRSRYFPALRNGVPISVRATRRVEFIVP